MPKLLSTASDRAGELGQRLCCCMLRGEWREVARGGGLVMPTPGEAQSRGASRSGLPIHRIRAANMGEVSEIAAVARVER